MSYGNKEFNDYVQYRIRVGQLKTILDADVDGALDYNDKFTIKLIEKQFNVWAKSGKNENKPLYDLDFVSDFAMDCANKIQQSKG